MKSPTNSLHFIEYTHKRTDSHSKQRRKAEVNRLVILFFYLMSLGTNSGEDTATRKILWKKISNHMLSMVHVINDFMNLTLNTHICKQRYIISWEEQNKLNRKSSPTAKKMLWHFLDALSTITTIEILLTMH